MRKVVFVAFFVLVAASVFAQLAKDDPRRGWHWYDDPAKEVETKPVQKKEEKPKEEIVKAPEEPKQDNKTPTVNTSVRDFEFPLTDEAKSIPVLAKWLKEPTEENAKEWLAWQGKYFKHNEQIARSLRNAYLTYGDIVYRFEGMSDQPIGQIVAAGVTQKKYKDVFNSVADRVGLFFFYKKGCDYCDAIIRPLQVIQGRYNFTIMGVVYDAADAKADMPFETRVAPRLFEQHTITSVPTLGAFNNVTKQMRVIAKGYTPADQIELNLKAFLLEQKLITEDDFINIWRTEDTEVLQQALQQYQQTLNQ